MQQRSFSMMVLSAPIALALLVSLPGCAATYGAWGPGGEIVSPEWDGQIVVNGRFDDHHHRDDFHHNQAFQPEPGRRPVAVGRARGRASMGSRGGARPTAGHAPPSGHAHAGGRDGHR